MAFFVELLDACVLVGGEGAKDESLELPDARAIGDSLYRGVFWQVNTPKRKLHHLLSSAEIRNIRGRRRFPKRGGTH